MLLPSLLASRQRHTGFLIVCVREPLSNLVGVVRLLAAEALTTCSNLLCATPVAAPDGLTRSATPPRAQQREIPARRPNIRRSDGWRLTSAGCSARRKCRKRHGPPRGIHPPH